MSESYKNWTYCSLSTVVKKYWIRLKRIYLKGFHSYTYSTAQHVSTIIVPKILHSVQYCKYFHHNWQHFLTLCKWRIHFLTFPLLTPVPWSDDERLRTIKDMMLHTYGNFFFLNKSISIFIKKQNYIMFHISWERESS